MVLFKSKDMLPCEVYKTFCKKCMSTLTIGLAVCAISFERVYVLMLLFHPRYHSFCLWKWEAVSIRTRFFVHVECNVPQLLMQFRHFLKRFESVTAFPTYQPTSSQIWKAVTFQNIHEIPTMHQQMTTCRHSKKRSDSFRGKTVAKYLKKNS